MVLSSNNFSALHILENNNLTNQTIPAIYEKIMLQKLVFTCKALQTSM